MSLKYLILVQCNKKAVNILWFSVYHFSLSFTLFEFEFVSVSFFLSSFKIVVNAKILALKAEF